MTMRYVVIPTLPTHHNRHQALSPPLLPPHESMIFDQYSANESSTRYGRVCRLVIEGKSSSLALILFNSDTR